MLSCDTNILFPALDSTSPYHKPARAFLESHASNESFCLCEQVLMEMYCLLRNPSVSPSPLSAVDAVQTIQALRTNPHWRIVDVTSTSPTMEEVWTWAAKPGTAFRKIFDLRLAATLQQHQVTEFATRNAKGFTALGFERVWNPLD